MVSLSLLFIILPLSSSLPLSTCDLCPAQSTCVFDADGHPSCLCDDGFASDLCEIPLCHEYFCFGQLSVCENTLQGPLCHCERGRTGSNCELYKGETAPWSSCANATFCEASFQNGNCDEICNSAECLFDGNDCQPENSFYAKEDSNPTNHNSSPLIESQDSYSIPLDLVLSVFSCILILISLILLVKMRRSAKKTSHVVYSLPSSHRIPRQDSSNYYLENSFESEIGYATVPAYVTVPYQSTPAISVIYEEV